MKRTVAKYILISSFCAILTILAFAFYSIREYEANEVAEVHVKLESSIKTFWYMLEDKGTDFRIVDGNLMAGNYQMNNNFELPDKVQAIFGGVATIFMGDERVTTNVLQADGKRAIGTRLTGPAYDAVIKQGKPYRGEAPILGESYLTAYDPIKDRAGKTIGVLFVGVKMSDFMAPLQRMQMRLFLTMSGMVAVFAAVMVVLGRAMKRVEDANENQLKLQEVLINTMPSPVFYKDAACRYLGCNVAFEAYVGFSRTELIGKTPHEIWPPELADRYQQQDLALLENPGKQIYETQVRFADGSVRNVIFNKATFEVHDGKVAGLVGVIQDITERKAAEDAIKNAYQQLLDIIEFLPDATFVLDMDKKVIAWNRAIEKMTGMEKKEILGHGNFAYAIPFYGERRPVLIDMVDEDHETLSKYLHVRREGATLFAETVIPGFRGSGESRYLWATATPLFDRYENRIGTIESIRDITEQRLAEQKRSLLEARLQHGQMLETFMVRLSHDLRTPLTPLFILFPLLQKRITDPELQRMLEICQKGAVSMKQLVDRAQMLVKFSAANSMEKLELTSLVFAVDRALADNADSLVQKHMSCELNIDPAIIISAVPDQLKELFTNLIANAARFSRENGTIIIAAEQQDEMLRVTVHDDGIGIESRYLERIFDEFFKADESRHDLDAPGLGLSICKRIVLNHHGRIWADSPGLGKGTTITFTLNENAAER